MTIRVFRRKPNKVEAMRLEPDTDNYKDACDWIHGVTRGEVDVSHDGRGTVWFKTSEGVWEAGPGDWIVRNGAGDFHPYRPRTFEAIFEEAQNGQGTPKGPRPR